MVYEPRCREFDLSIRLTESRSFGIGVTECLPYGSFNHRIFKVAAYATHHAYIRQLGTAHRYHGIAHVLRGKPRYVSDSLCESLVAETRDGDADRHTSTAVTIYREALFSFLNMEWR